MEEYSASDAGPAADRPYSRRRFIAVIVILGIIGVMIVVQFAGIMLGRDENVESAGNPDIERGAILDRNGRILALQTQLYTVSAWTPSVTDAEDTSAILGRVLDLDGPALLGRLRSTSGHLVIKRGATPTEIDRLRAEAGTDRLRGVSISPQTSRTYPEKELAAHVVGFVGVDNVGLEGIEYTFDRQLSPPTEGAPAEAALYGNQVFLTIDTVIQNYLRRVAVERLDLHQADSVMLLAMDATSGDILGYVSVPDYDPNTFASFEPDRRRNRPISNLYEPGSVFKIYSIASMLELDGISDTDVFPTDGVYDRISPPIRDLGNYGTIGPGGIIKYSSNVGAALASESVDEESFHDMLRRFGFGSRTGIQLNGEEAGILQPPGAWTDRTKPTIAFGQEIGVSALQMVAAATVFANDGILLRPRIVRKIVSPEGRVLEEFDREPVRRVVSPEVADLMLSYMLDATLGDGTARRARVEGLNVSAKTGTAQMIDPGTGTYSSDAFVASTLAIFPTEAPQVIVYAVIERPRGQDYYGGRIAAPLVAQLIEFLADYLGIGDDTPTIERPARVRVTVPSTPALDTVMPDLSGYSKRSLLPLLTRDDLVVRIQGEGWVVDQDPAPGEEIGSGSIITLNLE